MGRLLLVSNRLPITARFEKGQFRFERSSGGLAAGLSGPHQDSDGVWIGWPGELGRATSAQRRDLEEALESQRIVPVYMNRGETKAFYQDVSNEVFWPIFHYRVDHMPLIPKGWSTFQKVSERFARATIEAYRPGDTIWIHDYQLLLVPALIRQALPDASIGFFLHVPFPSPDVFSVIPWRREILEGVLGADLAGFHTQDYAQNFIDSCRRLLDLDTSASAVTRVGRKTVVGSFPLGVDAAGWAATASKLEVIFRAEEIRREARGRKLIIGVDRLDYTKGLLRRLTALEQLLDADPKLAQRLRFIQVAVPSRESLESYSSLKRRLDETIGRINGRFGTTADSPVRVLNRNLSGDEIASLYIAADIMMVTPLRDGMNLVAKEFIATRLAEDGVLILSEFAGAARELEGALVVNPYDVDDMARSIRQALEMPASERTARMQRLRAQVVTNDAQMWRETFLESLAMASRQNAAPVIPLEFTLAAEASSLSS